MVTVIDYDIRKNASGEEFIALILEGDIEMVQSQETGRLYATTRRCSLSSTFDEPTAQRMIGKELPGSIQKVECESYDYVIPDTGEVIQLQHTWLYRQEEVISAPVGLRVKKEELSENGIPVMV
jgi:hypothetical protein